MLRLLSVIAFCAGLLCLAQSNAQVPLTGAGLGTPTVATAYAGPGDIAGITWLKWNGLRAFSLAKTGTKAIRLINETTTTQQDINSLTNGTLDVATAATLCGVAVCKIVTFYDQSGALSCAGSTACDDTEATDANRAVFNLGPIVGINAALPSDTFNGTSTTYATAAAFAKSQPFSWSCLAQSPNAAQQGVWGSSDLSFETTGTPGFWFINDVDGGTSIGTANAQALNFSSFVGVHNGASPASKLNSNQYIATGTTSSALSGVFKLGSVFSQFLSGQIQECGFASGALTLSQQNAIIGNQQVFWGVNQIYTSNQGATTGTIIPSAGGALPSFWTQFTQDTTGITETLVGTGTEGGIPYIDVQISGTYSGTNSNFFQISPTNSSNILASPGQTFTAGFYVKVQAGSLAGITGSPYILLNEENGATFLDVLVTQPFTPTGAALNTQQYTASGTTANPSILSVETDVGFNYGPGNVTPVVLNFTLRIGYPTLVRTK